MSLSTQSSERRRSAATVSFLAVVVICAGACRAAATPTTLPSRGDGDGNGGATTGGFRLRASATSEAAAGGAVDISLELRNVSDKPGTYWETSPDLDFRFSVTREGDGPVGLTAYGSLIRDKQDHDVFERCVAVELAAGETRKYRVRVNCQHDMSLTGKYTIAARYVSRNQVAHANALTIGAAPIAVSIVVPADHPEPARPSDEEIEREFRLWLERERPEAARPDTNPSDAPAVRAATRP